MTEKGRDAISIASPQPRTTPTTTQRRNGTISVAVVEEQEIVRRGLVASLAEDQRLHVATAPADEPVGEDTDFAIVSSRAAGRTQFPCPMIVVCSDEPDAIRVASAGNRVVGVLHRGTLTGAQLRATVHAAAAGLEIQTNAVIGSHRPLAPRDQRLVELIADGLSTREIGEQMSYSERTIKKLIIAMEHRLEARNRAQLVAIAVRRGLI